MNQLSLQLTERSIDMVKDGESNNFDFCFEYAKEFIRGRQMVTSEDVIIQYKSEKLPEPKEPRVWGAVFRELKKLGFIEKAGFGHARIPSSHCKPINVWRVVKAA
jgi:hypothetical protein